MGHGEWPVPFLQPHRQREHGGGADARGLDCIFHEDLFWLFICMRIFLKSLAKGRSVISQEVTMSEEQAREAGIEGEVSCRAVVDALQFHIYMNISFACRVRAECSRCCTPISLPLSGHYRLVLMDRRAPRAGADDEADFMYDADDDEVDTRQALYDEIVISTPMMPLCSPSCRGVQPLAGGTAGKGEAEIDPRWETLRKLKQGQETKQ